MGRKVTVDEVAKWLESNIDKRWFYNAPFSAFLMWCCRLLRHFGVEVVEKKEKEED